MHGQLAAAATMMVAVCSIFGNGATAADAIQIGSFELSAPEKWKAVEPRSSIIAYEYQIPAAEGDGQAGRLTIMAAGGSIEANIDRWYGQWEQPDGKSTRERAKVTKKEVAGQTVHLVDVSGTYQDRRGPFSGSATPREKYRMLAAILETSEANYFVKFYGPEKTVAVNEDAFRRMVGGLEKR